MNPQKSESRGPIQKSFSFSDNLSVSLLWICLYYVCETENDITWRKLRKGWFKHKPWNYSICHYARWKLITPKNMNYMSEKRLPGTKKVTPTSCGLRPTIACHHRMDVLCEDSIDSLCFLLLPFPDHVAKLSPRRKKQAHWIKKRYMKRFSFWSMNISAKAVFVTLRACAIFRQRCFCAKTYYGKSVRHEQKLVHKSVWVSTSHGTNAVFVNVRDSTGWTYRKGQPGKEEATLRRHPLDFGPPMHAATETVVQCTDPFSKNSSARSRGKSRASTKNRHT
jgi:hypothetical protein